VILNPATRPVYWIGSSQKDYLEFPERVQRECGFALHLAQIGEHPPSSKVLKGFGSGVVELIENFDGDTYRTVYTIRFEKILYVLHAFKKKSNKGISTPKIDVDLIKRRVGAAEEHYRAHHEKDT
jgi:phage-related protein